PHKHWVKPLWHAPHPRQMRVCAIRCLRKASTARTDSRCETARSQIAARTPVPAVEPLGLQRASRLNSARARAKKPEFPKKETVMCLRDFVAGYKLLCGFEFSGKRTGALPPPPRI